MSNSFGTLFRFTTFGESHGKAIGCVIDGCPPGIVFDLGFIQAELNRRRPGQSSVTTERNEADEFEVLSGLFEGKTTGAPLTFLVYNKDQRSSDYDKLKDVYRPSHADFTYEKKYGLRDYRGSGRASARETLARVIAGAVAKQILKKEGIGFNAFVKQVGNISIPAAAYPLDLNLTEQSIVRCPHKETSDKIIELIEAVKADGDSVGGIISCRIQNVPVGLGEPVYNKLHAALGNAMLSINAVKGFEIGSGFWGSAMKGSQHNDALNIKNHKITHLTNNSGGVEGGISTGEEITFNVAFKPTSTIAKEQQTINIQNKNVQLSASGRHDACVLPRAVPIVEAMAAVVILDFWLMRFGYEGGSRLEREV
ncbi:MAG TPA: chorismate synthase [Bacteroidia bacterium]|nr:chorismate synthase [Bacteroidia bacterium]HNU32621.1 chorismate synthase [Bacteroidia bacterium]